jgi:SOS-response transcriptional repressor LexA
MTKSGRKPIKEITDKQKEVLKLIVDWIEEKGYQPSREDLAVLVGTTRHAITQRIWHLARKGYVNLPKNGGERRLEIPGIRFVAVRNDDKINLENSEILAEITKTKGSLK